MTNITDEREQSSTATEQVKERVQDVAQQAKGQTREQLRTQINQRSTQAGEQLSSAAGALRRTSEQLRTEGNTSAANLVDGVVDRGERLGDYLSRADGDQLLRDVEDLARKQPWLFVTGSAVVGFLAARFMKASSNSRYQGSSSAAYSYSGRRGVAAGEPLPLPAATDSVYDDGMSAGAGGGTVDLD